MSTPGTHSASPTRGRLADSVVDKVREQANLHIADLVSETVALKQAGNGAMKGLCPFHDEKTPSFQVNTNTGRYHCFGCGEDGDGIDFVKETNGGDFRWAVEDLAHRYGIQIEADNSLPDNRATLRAIVQEARAFFSAQLLETPPGHPARALLEDRGFDVKQAVEMFGCGYAPDSSSALLTHLRGKRFKDEDIIAAGLARANENRRGAWDFFRNRLLWAINSQIGYTIGFGARRLDPNDRLPAKFINTPETDLYKKSHVLFGLSDARKAISKTHRVIVVEGYTDVMAMHLAGVTNAVAACGTAFTADHLATLRRLVGEDGEITFALDDDTAGIKATMSVYALARESVKRLTVMPPSDGKDPDEYRQAHGDAALAALVEKRTPLIGTVIQNTIKAMPLETPEDRVVALDKVKEFFDEVKDSLVRATYAREVAALLGFNADDVERRMGGKGKASDPPPSSALQANPSQAGPPLSARLERDICAIMVQSEEAARAHAANAVWALALEPSKVVLHIVTLALKDTTKPWYTRLDARAENEDERKMLSMLSMSPIDVPAAALPDHLLGLIDRLEEERERVERSRLSADFKNADPERQLKILKALEKGCTE